MGTRERRQREARQRRQLILAAAKRLFWKQGYSRTKMPQIAAEAELAAGTLYLYFPSKSALYATLLEEGYGILRERLERHVAQNLPPRKLAEGTIDVFLRFASDHPEYFDIIFFIFQRESADWEGSLEEQQVTRLKTYEAACKAAAGRALERVASLGRPEEQAATVDAVWSMLAGVIFFFKNDPEFPAVARQAKRLLLSAVLAPK